MESLKYFLLIFLVSCTSAPVEEPNDAYMESFCVGHALFITDVENCVNLRNPVQPTPHNNEEHQAVGGVDFGFQTTFEDCYNRLRMDQATFSLMIAELSQKEHALRLEHDCPKDWRETRVP